MDDRINEIKAREQAATPGPWMNWPEKSFNVQSPNRNIACCFRNSNAAFIANARADIPALLSEVERLTAQICKLEADLDEADKDGIKLAANRDAWKARAVAAIEDLNRDGTCDTCKRGPDNHKCGKCGVGCYEWRGPEPGKEPSEC
jgi:outer membrane murein-binding lipoprotein Lpp